MRRSYEGLLSLVLLAVVWAVFLGLLEGVGRAGRIAAIQSAEAANGEIPRVDSNVTRSYPVDAQAAVFRGPVAVADGTSIPALTATPTGEFAIGKAGAGSRSNLSVSARFSNGAQACKVRILYLYRAAGVTTGPPTSVLGLSGEVTLTASAFTDGAGLFAAPTYVFDDLGATHARVVVTVAPGVGSVSFWCGSF